MENYSDRLHEIKLGIINPEIKNVKLSKRTEDILAGRYDNEPLDPVKFPLLVKFQNI